MLIQSLIETGCTADMLLWCCRDSSYTFCFEAAGQVPEDGQVKEGEEACQGQGSQGFVQGATA